MPRLERRWCQAYPGSKVPGRFNAAEIRNERFDGHRNNGPDAAHCRQATQVGVSLGQRKAITGAAA
ncbi:hypothetical protein ASC96_27250 [Rhizobium sp. Root1204]|nr:hypothetical protein ASC96_27250 [Rhizobium sp. Root1204]